jgi:molecular chaperone DnaK
LHVADEHQARGEGRQGPILGIDLGTTNSGVAVWDEARGRVVMLPGPDGSDLVPSVVAWDEDRGEWLVGHAAAALRSRRPGAAAYSVKRFIGRWFTDPKVLYHGRDLGYRLVSGGGKDALRDVLIDFGHPGAPVTLTAPEVSAKVLSQLRQNAAGALGLPLEAVRRAVVTVPAYFNASQRQATILAGELAGLEVLDLLNEPTAAALACGEVLEAREKTLLVYDLGGGTFDVSLLEASRDEAGYAYFTRVVDGDTCLGGDDIDTALARRLAEVVAGRCGTPPADALTRELLRGAAEGAKVALSGRERVRVSLPAGGGEVAVELARPDLEACAADVLRRTQAIARRAVEEVAGLRWDRLDEVILVGGQTLMPAVRQAVAELCGRPPRAPDRPQLAVALGAGEYARILALGREKFHQNALVNVIALPLGIRLEDHTFEELVPANATLPHSSRAFPVTTVDDNQTAIRVEVLQGPRGARRADECVVLGGLDMEVPPAPARTPRLEVQLEVQSDGTMKVAVTDTRRDRRATLDIFETRILAWRDREGKQAVPPQGK